ncbi:hypothetical protein EBB07_07750 [Paenibacillaceae bacterium]|nr:hypothetical protein EBB07_07750 [Paenibacillaceae bacterium]
MKKFVLLLLLAAIMIMSLPETAEARLPYRSFYYDANQKQYMWIQSIYEPSETTGVRIEEPSDIFVDSDDNVYVTDKKTGKVYVLDSNGYLQLTIGADEGEGMLRAPEGLFVTPDGTIYVADSGNGRIALFSTEGTYLKEYKKPDSTALGGEPFIPTKLVVDRRGVMYINLNSSYNGLLRINPQGEFMGYFGANKAKQSVVSWLKRQFLNKEQLAKEIASLPMPIGNVSLDHDGFIYTATSGDFGKAAIRKLNAGGVDAYKSKTFNTAHGIVDVAIDNNGFIYNVDTVSASINIYNDEGDPLFLFGMVDNETQQYGVIGYPTGLAVDSKLNIWVSDSRTGTVHKFVRTEFGNDVMNALTLYKDGRYDESKPYWERVHTRNDMFNGTYQGLGKVYLHEGEFGEALDYLQAAFDTENYSKAYWQVRLSWLQNNFPLAAAIVIAVLALLVYAPRLIRALLRKHPIPDKWEKTVSDLRNFHFTMFHPYQGFYKLKESKIGVGVILLLLAVVVIVNLLNVYLTGFLFNPVEIARVNIFGSLAFFFIPWVTWIIANYLVCSVRDGEGRFREVLQGSVYALAPFVFLSIPIVILSNIVTYEERILVDSLTAIMYIWLGIMLFVKTQVIHNFDFMESLGNIGITVFTIGTIWLFVFITSGLTYNLYDFFYQLYKEATFIG